MQTPVLVLLDGSPEAERALPVAAAIARRTGSSLELIRLNPALAVDRSFLPGRWPDTPSDPTWRISFAGSYLRELARRVVPRAECPISTAVLDGPMHEVLAGYLRRASGVVVVAAKGDGVAPGTLGRLADCALRHHDGPVILVPAAEGMARLDAEWRCDRLLVALDGLTADDGSFAPALRVARAFGSDVTLAESAAGDSDADVSGARETASAARPAEHAVAAEAVADWLGASGARIELSQATGVREASAVAAIAAALDVDLIVVGRNGDGQGHGSSLTELLSLATAPVMSLAAAQTGDRAVPVDSARASLRIARAGERWATASRV